MTLTAELASLSAGFDADPPTAHAATRCIVDWAGCAVSGSRHELVEALVRARRIYGPGDVTLIGRSDSASVGAAALINGAASHVLDFDDVNTTMIGHPGVVVIPAVLALAEELGLPGEACLSAIATGYEVAERLGSVVNPGHYERGWHATATLGCIAAAAASARVLGLDPEAATSALGLAATQAGGVRRVFGSHGKGFHAGRAAGAGVLAAVAASEGVRVPEDVLEGPRGYLALVSDGAAPRPPRPGPAILRTAFKAHAACGATHALIDAVAGLVRDHAIDPSRISSIEAQVYPLALLSAGKEAPSSGLEAKFSLWHTAAMAAYRHPLTVGDFADDTFAPPEVVALRRKVTVSANPSFEYDQAMPADVRIVLEDGTEYQRMIDTPWGRPGNPMSDGDLSAKFTTLAAPTLGETRSLRALDGIWGLGSTGDVRSVLAGFRL